MFGFYCLCGFLLFLIANLVSRPPPGKWITQLLICLCVLHFLCMMIFGAQSVAPMANNPMGGPSTTTLLVWGGQTTSLLRDSGEYERLATSIFVHAGLLHLLLNCLSLHALGMAFELRFGSLRTAVLFLGTGVFASLITALILPRAVSVGASGAICGLFGAQWADLLRRRLLPGPVAEDLKPELDRLLQTTLYIALFSCVPTVNAAAHGAGLGYGILLGVVLTTPRLPCPSSWPPQPALVLGALALVGCIGAPAWAWTRLRGPAAKSAPPSWGHYLLCFDTPFWSCDDYLGPRPLFEAPTLPWRQGAPWEVPLSLLPSRPEPRPRLTRGPTLRPKPLSAFEDVRAAQEAGAL